MHVFPLCPFQFRETCLLSYQRCEPLSKTVLTVAHPTATMRVAASNAFKLLGADRAAMKMTTQMLEASPSLDPFVPLGGQGPPRL